MINHDGQEALWQPRPKLWWIMIIRMAIRQYQLGSWWYTLYTGLLRWAFHMNGCMIIHQLQLRFENSGAGVLPWTLTHWGNTFFRCIRRKKHLTGGDYVKSWCALYLRLFCWMPQHRKGNRKSVTPRPWRPWDSHSKWQAALGRCMVWTSKMGNLCIQENVVSQTK